MYRRMTIAAMCMLVGSGASADMLDIGAFHNIGGGEIAYDGPFGDFITSGQLGDLNQYTNISIDIAGLLDSVGVQAFAAISVIDTGENAYNDSPGADIDLFRMTGLSQGNSYTLSYDGPTQVHQDEHPSQLAQRVNELDWGTNGGQLTSMTYVSLGELGVLHAQLDQVQQINGSNQGLMPIGMDISEAGAVERFRIVIETAVVPAPGAIGLMGVAGLGIRRRRRRAR